MFKNPTQPTSMGKSPFDVYSSHEPFSGFGTMGMGYGGGFGGLSDSHFEPPKPTSISDAVATLAPLCSALGDAIVAFYSVHQHYSNKN